MDVASRSETEPTPSGVDWGSLIWPGGRPTGDAQVLADRAAAAAAIAARAEDTDPEPEPAKVTARGRAGAVWGERALAVRPPASAPAPPTAPTASAAPATLVAPPASQAAQAPAQTAGHVADVETVIQPEAKTELEPWNPEATYESLVLLLAELKALHPDEVAMLPRRPSRFVIRRPGRLLAAVVAAAVLVGGVGTFVETRGNGAKAPAVVVAPHVSTVLIAIEANGALDGANLLASDGKRGQEILLPSRLLVDVPGQGSTQLSAAPGSGAGAAAAAVENALHVRIDGTWVLDPTSLAALVDAEGGVDVTLTNDVLPGDGSTTLDIGVGTSHITGAQAGQLALAIGSQEPEASRLARQQILIEAILAKLPASPAQIAPLLQNAQLDGTLTPATLATVIGGVRDEIAAGQAASTVVPNDEIDSGSGTPSYGLDEAATATMVSNRLAGAALPTPVGGRSRILVENGVGLPGLGDQARAVLVAKGYSFRSGGNAASFGAEPSVVLIPDSTTQSRALGTAITQLLGLPASAVQLDSNPTTIADAKVILGSDYKPQVTPTP
jgi:LytR_cpsA_psr family/LytR cell envelope-related transcriptional attenuator